MTTVVCEGWHLAVQGQANKWVKNMEAQNGLRVLNLAMPDLLRQMENAIQFGNPALLQVRYPVITTLQSDCCLQQESMPLCLPCLLEKPLQLADACLHCLQARLKLRLHDIPVGYTAWPKVPTQGRPPYNVAAPVIEQASPAHNNNQSTCIIRPFYEEKLEVYPSLPAKWPSWVLQLQLAQPTSLACSVDSNRCM